MKILLLPSWYPSEADNTAGTFIREQARALKQYGVEVRVLYPFDRCIKPGDIVLHPEDGILTYRCNTDYLKNSKLSRVNSTVKVIKALRRIKKEYGFELIHAHVCYFAGIIGYFYKKIYGTRYIITEHMSYIGSYAKKKYDYILLKKAYGSADKVICVSEYLADSIEKLGFEFKRQIIGNVVDTDVFCGNGSKCFKDDNVNIVFVGSMGNDEVKGVNYLLKAFSLLVRDHKNVKLHLVGDGQKRKEYEELSVSLGIDDKCRFYGKLPKSNVALILRSCSFFVLPSKYETFGTVIIEALACGKPVVTTDTGAQKEIINDSSLGYLVHSQDVKSLYEGLSYMLRNYNKYDAKHLKKAAQQYSYESIAKKLNDLYKQILLG